MAQKLGRLLQPLLQQVAGALITQHPEIGHPPQQVEGACRRVIQTENGALIT